MTGGTLFSLLSCLMDRVLAGARLYQYRADDGLFYLGADRL